MITFQSDKMKEPHTVTLINTALFRTKPIRFAAKTGEKMQRVREKKPSDCYTLLFGQSDCFHVRVEEKTLCLKPQSLLLIEPMRDFSIYADESKNALLLCVEFEMHPLDTVLQNEENAFFYLENASSLKTYFDELFALPDDCYAYGEAILLTLFENARVLSLKKQDPRFFYRQTLKRIRAHIADAPNNALIAFGTHCTPDYLSRILKRSHGVTLSALLKRERLKALKSYLRFTSFTEEHTSSILAFSSLDAMIAFFRYHTGISPAEYRKKKRLP